MVIESDAVPQNPIADFEDFLKTFEGVPNDFKYRKRISEAFSKTENHIDVLFEDILNFNPTLANYLRNTPEQALKDAVEAFKNILRIDSGGQLDADKEYFVRICSQNNSCEVKLRQIRAKHIDKMIYVKAIVIRSTPVRPEITVAAWQCPLCGTIQQVNQLVGKLKPPHACSNTNCNNTKDFQINTENSVFIDYQNITVQETPEELRAGTIPQVQSVILLHDLVDTVRPGERVKVMGILKTFPTEEGPGKLSAICKTQLMANSIEGMEQSDDEIDITPQDIANIIALSQEPMIQKKIARSIARTIMGHDHLKQAASLSLFAGIQKMKKDGSKIRGDIHVLFMGDPGTGKSQILQNCAQLAPRAIYTSGKGASAAGLTAAVVRENDSSGLQLEAGALVLSSGGVACIDEFDKMKNDDRVAIHEAMEQQSYHPSFEFSFSNGHTKKIGEFVDELFLTRSELAIEGKNCEILTTHNLDYKIFSSNFKEEFELPINRVSRHKAPPNFFKISYSNGQFIIVTPEHPVFCFQENQITTVDACKITKGLFAPSSLNFHQNNHDVNGNDEFLPPNITHMILECLEHLGISLNGEINELNSNHLGIKKGFVQQYLRILDDRINLINSEISKCRKIADLRQLTNYSQEKIGTLIGINPERIDFLEQKSNPDYESKITFTKIIEEFNPLLVNIQNKINFIKDMTHLRWLMITTIEELKNEGEYQTEWVYDVTIEPTENFISHGLILHNTVSIAKAGIVATLQSKTAIIAAANPKMGRYDEYASASENINLPPPILSRFDLIYVVRDKPERNNDDKIAEYILKSHMQGYDETYIEEANDTTTNQPPKEEYIPMELLKKYIRYARKTCHPRISKDAAIKIKDFYVNLRNSNGEGNSAISIVARNLDGIVRMVEAYAKMALRDVVIEDVDAVLDLVKKSLHDVGYDEATGTYDIDKLVTGTSSSKRQKLETILRKINDLQAANPKEGLKLEDIEESLASEQGIDKDFLTQALESWVKDGTLFHPKPSEFKLVNMDKSKKKGKPEENPKK